MVVRRTNLRLEVPKLRVGRNAKGRGVYAVHPIADGNRIETCHCVLMSKSDLMPGARLHFYAYCWDDEQGEETMYAVPTGYGLLYNHSYAPNAYYERVRPDKIVIFALRDIKAGEEILINYNGDPDDTTPMNFTVKE